MKLNSLIPAAVLAMAVFVQGQNSPAPQESKPRFNSIGEGSSGAAATPTPGGAESDSKSTAEVLSLPSGPLADVVSELESQFRNDPALSGVVLPNLLYAKDTRNVAVPGELTLRNVTPVQALALVAAAADCTLRPIFAPDEKAGQKTMIIGYRFESQAASGSGRAGDGSAMSTPRSPSEFSGASSGPTQSRGSVQVVDPNAPAGTGPGSPPARVPKNSTAEPAGMPADHNQPFVKVYAIGFIRTGTDEEKGGKVKSLESLILTSLNMAKLDLNQDIDIHMETGALLAKATAAQHEIIEQVVQAMKENATQPTVPAKP